MINESSFIEDERKNSDILFDILFAQIDLTETTISGMIVFIKFQKFRKEPI